MVDELIWLQLSFIIFYYAEKVRRDRVQSKREKMQERKLNEEGVNNETKQIIATDNETSTERLSCYISLSSYDSFFIVIYYECEESKKYVFYVY